MNSDQDSSQAFEQQLRQHQPSSAEMLAHRVFYAAGQRAAAQHQRTARLPHVSSRSERVAWAATVLLAVVVGHWSGRTQMSVVATSAELAQPQDRAATKADVSNKLSDPVIPAGSDQRADKATAEGPNATSGSAPAISTGEGRTENLPGQNAVNGPTVVSASWLPGWWRKPGYSSADLPRAAEANWSEPWFSVGAVRKPSAAPAFSSVEQGLAWVKPPPTRGQLMQELVPGAPTAKTEISNWFAWWQVN